MNKVISVIVLFTAVGFSGIARCHAACLLSDFQCNDGTCLDPEKLCDGTKDCPDGSDETAKECIQNTCLSYAFQCAYGGCVHGNAKCNGVQDCADNSDESGCNQSASLSKGVCGDYEFACKSKQCIQNEDVCDGQANCDDSSDENVETCGLNKCASYAFRCAYGACISSRLKCDHKFDCLDGSDELETLCGSNHYVAPTKKPHQDSNCKVPPGLMAKSYSGGTVIESGVVQNGQRILFVCPREHVLVGTSTDICINGEFFNLSKNEPKCFRYCSDYNLVSPTVQSVCNRFGQSVKCEGMILPDTVAKISCKVGYILPADQNPTNTAIRCQSDGHWTNRPFRCDPICGKISPTVTAFIKGGSNIGNITKVPWHAAVYRKSNARFEQICGATIINAKVLISAAHCFWKGNKNEANHVTQFAIGVGKYYRDFYFEESYARFFNISQIKLGDNFGGLESQFHDDIAIIVLNNFIQFNEYVSPACLAYPNYNNRILESGVRGRIVGWGNDGSGKSTSVLNVVTLPILNQEDCLKQDQGKYSAFIKGDKFCAGNLDGETVCDGDSGGGFIINKNDVHYLWGVVSVGLKPPNSPCTGQFITTFTNIYHFSDMIQDCETSYRP